MRLLSLYVDNFGKLSNFAYDFKSTLNTVYKENGLGKTTLAAFIKAMLYGLNKDERLKYTPWTKMTGFVGYLVYEVNNKTYLIELEDYLIHPGDTFTLHKEWNNGVIPKSKFLKARVIRMHGRMIQFDAFDTNYEGDAEGDHYSDLWLPLKSIHLRRIIN